MGSLSFDLTGRCAVVTGAGRGLGQGMAIGLAEAGADVVLVGPSNTIRDTDEKIKALDRSSVTVKADLSDRKSSKKIVDAAIDAFGKVDILVNNAGIIRRNPAIDFSEKDWDEVIEVNQSSVFFLSQACARDMIKRSYGKIINIASLLTFSGGITVPSYAASKGAVAQITKALCNEWAKHGINVNAIAPGYFATDNTKALREDAARYAEISARIPAGRWGTPDDLKGAAVFLASEASDYVHGAVLLVDGGWMAR